MNRPPRPGQAVTAGPFHTEAQAQASPVVRSAYSAAKSAGDRGSLVASNRRMLDMALSGVQLGDYDREIVGQLAALDPHVVVVIAGLITRAGAGGDR